METYTKSQKTLEEKYLQLKRTLYERLFSYLMIMFAAIAAPEIFRAIIQANLAIIIGLLMIFAFVAIILNIIRNSKENQAILITICNIIFYASCIANHYYGDTGFFQNSLDTFYLSYGIALFEMQIATRIPILRYKILYSASAAFSRTLLLPANDKGIYFIHLMALLFNIFLEYEKEKSDQKLFRSDYNSKEQLLKFKNLVLNDIPSGIIIISQDLKKSHFVNNFYNQLLESEGTSSIQNQFNKFILQENNIIIREDESSRADRSNQQTTLWTILESNSVKHNELHQKSSCNLNFIYDKNVQQKQSYFFEVRVFPLIWDEENSIAIVFHDITQQRAILNLEGANAHKDSVLAAVSHELRTPLNGMLGMIQIMQKNIFDPKMPYYLNICKKNGYLLLSLVNSILDLNQIRANKLKLNPEKVILKELLDDILSLFEFQSRQKGLFLRLNISPSFGVNSVLYTDKNRLSQILINLIGNALKFTKEGGITISVSLVNEEYVKFSVEDSGIGIKEEDKIKLFQKFGKLEQEGDQLNQNGVGLGLTISNNLSKILFNGEEAEGIHLKSTFGKGSIFSFLIRKTLKDLEDHDKLKHSHSISSTDDFDGDIKDKLEMYSTPRLKKPLSLVGSNESKRFSTSVFIPINKNTIPRSNSEFLFNSSLSLSLKNPISVSSVNDKILSVLVVDDNPFNIAVAECLVASQGYKVKSALSGQTAIELVRTNNYLQEPIKLILMDCQMPEMDGYQTTKILKLMMEKGDIPKIPIISLTATDSESEKILCKKAGMCDHLSKPLQDSELQKILKKYN